MDTVRWNTVPVETIGDAVQRQIVWGTQGNLTRFSIAKGGHVSAHSHPAEQFTCVLTGALKLRIGDREIVLGAGDMLVIPPHAEHEAWAVEDVTLLDFFAPAREDWRRGEHQYLTG